MAESTVELIMPKSLLAVAYILAFLSFARAQNAEIAAVNAQWIEFFNRGDFTGLASLYTEDAHRAATRFHYDDWPGRYWNNVEKHSRAS
jgi:hypothetical protein